MQHQNQLSKFKFTNLKKQTKPNPEKDPKRGCWCASSMFSPSKCVQYVNDACGCHEVPRLPSQYCWKVSCMQMDGVGLCTKRGSNCSVLAELPFSASSNFQSVFIQHIYIQILKEKKNQSVKQPYSDSASSNTIVLCNSGSVCN